MSNLLEQELINYDLLPKFLSDLLILTSCLELIFVDQFV